MFIFRLIPKMLCHQVFLEWDASKAPSFQPLLCIITPLCWCLRESNPGSSTKRSIFKTSLPPHCYDPTHSALVLNKEKQYNTVDFISRAEYCDSFPSQRLEELLRYAICSSHRMTLSLPLSLIPPCLSLFHSQLNSLALLPCCQCAEECKLRWQNRY